MITNGGASQSEHFPTDYSNGPMRAGTMSRSRLPPLYHFPTGNC